VDRGDAECISYATKRWEFRHQIADSAVARHRALLFVAAKLEQAIWSVNQRGVWFGGRLLPLCRLAMLIIDNGGRIGMASNQIEKANRFRALHAAPGAFVIANAWDAGSARLLAGIGFAALATSSGAAAGVLGRRDGMITRDESLANARAVVDATDLPVSADLEKGFGDTPGDAALTIRLAGDIGLVGGSIEDSTGNARQPLFDATLARERISAAVEAARAMPFPFMLTARAEGFLRGNPDLDDIVRRLQSFEAAGADVLMAPGLPDLAAVRTVCSALSKPFNFMAGIRGKSFSVPELAQAGVKRISLATSLYRAAMTGLLNAAREVKEKGTIGYVETTMATPELSGFMRG
jgi:2-methylisocitrate lyase-like PEP mutase family enzyme